MRYSRTLLVFGVCWLSTGCELSTLMHQNLTFEASQSVDGGRASIRNRLLADAAWRRFCKASPGLKPSEDYRSGFTDGFTDCLKGSGVAVPPALPPSKYWASRYQEPEGHKAVEDWFAGFHEGVMAAQASGRTQCSTARVAGAVVADSPQPIPTTPPGAVLSPAEEAVLPAPQGSPWPAPALAPIVGDVLSSPPSGPTKEALPKP